MISIVIIFLSNFAKQNNFVTSKRDNIYYMDNMATGNFRVELFAWPCARQNYSRRNYPRKNFPRRNFPLV